MNLMVEDSEDEFFQSIDFEITSNKTLNELLLVEMKTFNDEGFEFDLSFEGIHESVFD